MSKKLQSKDMHLDIAIDQLKGLVSFFEKYRENGFESAMNATKEIVKELNIEPKFREKRVIYRKKRFDENNNDEVRLSSEESFRIEFFLHIVDQVIVSIKTRFEQFVEYEEIFGFLFDLKKCSCEDTLKSRCIDLESFLKVDEHSDIDGCDLFSELRVLKEVLPVEINTPSLILDYVTKMDSFPNTSIAYRILLTVPVTVASAERSFSKLKILKTYLRSTMTQERLNGLTILSIERDILESLEYKPLIKNFASQKARKMFK